MHWQKKIEDHVFQWLKNIPTFFKRSSVDVVVEVEDLSDDTKKENEIDTEGLAIKLSKHFPDLHSVTEKNAEIQELKDTLQRLQQDFTDEIKQTVLQSLREDDTKKASVLLKKLILPHASNEEQPTEMTAWPDWN